MIDHTRRIDITQFPTFPPKKPQNRAQEILRKLFRDNVFRRDTPEFNANYPSCGLPWLPVIIPAENALFRPFFGQAHEWGGKRLP